MKDYRVIRDGFVMNSWRKEGEIIPLTDREARYLAPPTGTHVEPYAAPKAGKARGRRLKREATE